MNDLSNEIKEIKQNLAQLTVLFLSQKTVLTFEEFCKYCGISTSYGYKLTSQGKVPHFKPAGKMVYFDRNEIDVWLLQNPVKTQAQIETEAVNHVLIKNKKGGSHE